MSARYPLTTTQGCDLAVTKVLSFSRRQTYVKGGSASGVNPTPMVDQMNR